ncbi:MAG: Ni/Fe hydrogenase subunit alpha [Alphaproteobacteria bacterium]|nr:Ni/Fe hydrogenase subunit alpha [Alphaproteobacteria bacterium]
MSDERTIQVDYLARVEGEGALTLKWKDGRVSDLALSIFEPPRFFEAFLRGRSALEAPDITARICGICPVAYQMSACNAIEDALGVQIPEPLHQLRRLLYCGEWIESHVLHMAMLHAPDFFGVPDAMTLAQTHKDEVVAALAAKKAGNRIVATLGGREIHPINVRVGGFYRLPRPEEIDTLRAELEAARPKLEAVVRWTGTFDFPDLERDVPFLSLCPGDVYPFVEAPLASTVGHRFSPQEWGQHVVEEHVERSNALHARLDGEVYQVGPLARFALNFDALPAGLQQLARDIGAAPPVRNPFRSLLVRGIEALYAMDEALRILDSLVLPAEPSVPVTLRAGVGHGVSEAPRGVLYHRYELDDDGLIVDADIVPPTAQNQLSIEADLWALADGLWEMEPEAATLRAEQAIRNYDPCISCATHFLTLHREPG